MRLSDFSFTLPDELIAQHPLSDRSSSRLLELDGATGSTVHHQFRDLPSLLRPNDLLILNNTKVINARLFGRKETGGRVEIMVERLLNEHHNQVLARIRASKTPANGSKLLLEQGVSALVVRREAEFWVLEFDQPPAAVLAQQGHMPLPPYIKREATSDDSDRYQTVYGSEAGAVAAPTAGLHFDDALFEALSDASIRRAFVTLHVGAGTFQPVRVEHAEDHVMHAEKAELSQATVDAILDTRAAGGRVIAVGTTTVRTLESAAFHAREQFDGDGAPADQALIPWHGETRLFMRPGMRFHVVDGMITNFHLPESTLMLLVAAFSGHQQILSAYKEAIEARYRFYSYGDAMLLWPDRALWQSSIEAI